MKQRDLYDPVFITSRLTIHHLLSYQWLMPNLPNLISNTIRNSFIFTVFLYLFMFPGSSMAETKLMLLPDYDKVSLGTYMATLRDETGNLTIQDVSSQELSNQFTPNSSSSINLGSTQHVYWFKCTIKTPGHKEKEPRVGGRLNSDEWILYLGKHLDFYNDITIFWQEKNPLNPVSSDTADGWQKRELGMNHAVKTGKRDPIALKVNVPQGGTHDFTIYMRIQTAFGLFLDSVLYAPAAFHSFSRKLSLFYGVYYGIALSMIIFNLFHFYFLRDRVRLIFIIYTLTLCAYFFVSNELAFSLIPAALLPATLKGSQSLALLTFIQMLWFTRAFLNLKELQPKLNNVLSYVMLLPVGLLLSLPFFSYAAIGKVISDVGLLVLVTVILTGTRGLIIGYRPARFFLFGWGFFLLGGLIYALNFKGIFPYPFIGNNAAQAGSGIEMLFLSVAIADRVKYLLAQMQRVEKKRQKQLKVISHKLVQAEEKERRRIAEILHDSIGQTILATRWEVERLISKEILSSGQASKLMRFLHDTIQETRTLTKELYPKELQIFGLKKSLESMAEAFTLQHDLDVRIRTESEAELTDEKLNIVIYRSVSELLINAVKHAGAKLVEINILIQNDLIYVIVQDDGIGFDHRINSDPNIKGFGLFKIQETLNNLQGSLKVGCSRTGGAQITLTIPMSKVQA